MPNWLLSINVIEGPLPYLVWGLTLACVIALLARRPSGGWWLRALIGILAGALVGVLLVFVVDATDMFGAELPPSTAWWIGASFAAVGLAIVSLWKSAVWRKIVAIALIVLSILSTTLGINAAFGIDKTIGAMIGISSGTAIDALPGPNPSATPTGPVYTAWNPPADMPQKGKVGLLSGSSAIPSSAGFKPRDASIYLPPAAQVENAPPLPLVVFMMGKPGNPDPSFIAEALDAMAAQHKGLAPIVIVADQLGDPGQDPACADSKKFGGVSTYFNKDIPAFAKAKLNIIQDPQYWTIIGYSNGGGCSFKWGSEFPAVWGNLVSISGDEFPGLDDPNGTTTEVFAGDASAFAAAKPSALLESNKGKFAGHLAIFTAGQNDPGVIAFAERNAKLATDAGFTVTNYVVPGADHQEAAIRGGLPKAFEVLYPHLGLSAPAS